MDDTILEFKDLTSKYNISLQFVADELAVSKSQISQWQNKIYKGKAAELTEKIKNFIQREKARRTAWQLPIVEISTMQYVREIAQLCHNRGRIGVCVGCAGLGKTVAAKEYIKQYPDAILIESNYSYTARSLLLELHKILGLSCKGCVYDLMEEVVEKMTGSGRLIIIDEAENLRREALELTRRIHDKTGVGLLLIGREILLKNLRGKQNQYDQLYSRVMYRKNLEGLVLNDVSNIVDGAGLKSDLANSFFGVCKRNTRRLEHLISNSLSVAMINGNKEVDAAIIEETAKMLMDKEN